MCVCVACTLACMHVLSVSPPSPSLFSPCEIDSVDQTWVGNTVKLATSLLLVAAPNLHSLVHWLVIFSGNLQAACKRTRNKTGYRGVSPMRGRYWARLRVKVLPCYWEGQDNQFSGMTLCQLNCKDFQQVASAVIEGSGSTNILLAEAQTQDTTILDREQLIHICVSTGARGK
jgi:hypothetical protein